MAADIEFVMRQILAPSKDWLTEAEVLLALGNISSRTLDTWIQKGFFPRGEQFGREKKWNWKEIAGYYLGKEYAARMERNPDEEAA